MDYQILAGRLQTLTVFRKAAGDPVLSAAIRCLEAADCREAAIRYAELAALLLERGLSLYDYVLELARCDCNAFTLAAGRGKPDSLPPHALQAAARDLSALYALAVLDPGRLVQSIDPSGNMGLPALPPPSLSAVDWGEDQGFAEFYRINGVGQYAKYAAFRYGGGEVVPLEKVDPIRLCDLKQYGLQKKRIVENTLAFLSGQPYHNALLYGDRGTGKSSTVKALLNEYSCRRLRMVELGKRDVAELDKLIAHLSGIPMKFIVFIDDLVFREDDDNFNILKAALEGSLAARPDNVAIYATTNRRHLIKETFSAREGNEVHRGDTLDDSLSLSDRFGLTVTFTKPGKDEFLEIVRLLAGDRGLEVPFDELAQGAERFALLSGGRSPRAARQYVDQLEARLNLHFD